MEEETRTMRERELSISPSRYRSETDDRITIKDADIDVGTTEDGPCTDAAGSGKIETSNLLIDCRSYAPQVCFTYHLYLYFLCIGDNSMLFLLRVELIESEC